MLEQVRRKAVELGNGLEHNSNEKQLRVFSPEKKKELKSYLIALYNSLKDIVARWGLASSHRKLAIQ